MVATIGHADGDRVQPALNDRGDDGQNLADPVIFNGQRACRVVLKIAGLRVLADHA